MTAKRFQWIAAFLTVLSGAVLLYAQNPVSISQVGTTPVTTTVPVSGTVTANAGSGTMAVSGTFWQATQPVSGTFWQATQPISAAALPLPTGAATEATLDARTGSLTEAAPATDTASSGLNGRLQRIAQRLTSLLAVFPTTIDTNSGNKSASTLRVVLATDQPALTNKLLVTPDSVALPANQSVNVNQINGVTPLMNAGNTGTGSPRVTIATDQAALAGMGVGATGAAPPANANYIAGITSGATGGFLSAGVTVCDSTGWLDMTTATTTEIAPLVSSRTIRVCQIVAMSNGTSVMTFKRGTGTNCGTGTTSVSPAFDLTAQTGFSAGTGFGEIIGPAGAGTVGGAMTSGNALCVTNSAAVNLHVMIRYAVY